jgi:hypothetical protein
MRLVFKVLIVSAVILLAFIGLAAYSASQLEVVSAGISGVEGLSLSGVALLGEIEVVNSGFLPARVDRITYEAYLEGVDGLIATGELTGGTLRAGEAKNFPFIVNVEWVPSLETAMDLFFSEKTSAVVNGTVHLVELKGLLSIEIPFSAEASLEGYIEQFVPEAMRIIPEGVAGDVAGIMEGIVDAVSESVKEGAGMLGDAIS